MGFCEMSCRPTTHTNFLDESVSTTVTILILIFRNLASQEKCILHVIPISTSSSYITYRRAIHDLCVYNDIFLIAYSDICSLSLQISSNSKSNCFVVSICFHLSRISVTCRTDEYREYLLLFRAQYLIRFAFSAVHWVEPDMVWSLSIFENVSEIFKLKYTC